MDSRDISLEINVTKLAISEGRSIDPTQRRSIEGVNADYLSNMSDSDYLAALVAERNSTYLSYRAAYDEVMALVAPNFPKPIISPSFSKVEAASTLEAYVGNLTSLVQNRNTFFDYINADTTHDYLLDRFGEEGAKKQLAQIQGIIDNHDDYIKNALASLDSVFTLSNPVASLVDGKWKLNTVNGGYRSDAGVSYQFSIDENGTTSGS